MNEKEEIATTEATEKVNKKELSLDDAIKLTKEFPTSHRAHCILGNVYMQNGENEKCIKQIKKSLKFGKSSPAFNISAMCKVNLELFEDAKKDFLDALEINPNDPNTILSYSNLLNKMGEHKERHKIIKRLGLITPKNISVREAIIRSFFSISDFHGAVEYIEAIINDFEDDHQIHYLLGASLCATNRFEEAKISFKKALQKTTDPDELKKDIENNFIALD